MSNGYYSHTTYPPTNSSGASAPMRSELDALMAGFDLLPDPLGIGQKGFSGGTWSNPTIQNGTINGTTIGATARSTGAFTALAANGGFTFAGGGSMAGTIAATAAAILSGFAIQGGSLDNTPIGNTTRNLGKFTTLDTTGAVHVGGALTIDGALSSGTGGLEIGNPAVAGASFVDFHSSGASSDYDGRIIVTGGNATAGKGTMSYNAAAHVFSVRPSWGAVPWDTTSLPNPVQTTGAGFIGDIGLDSNGSVTPNLRFSTAGGGYKAYMRANAGGGTLEFINNAYSAVNMALRDDGYLSVRNGANFGLRPTWQGFVPWDNNNLTALSQLTNNMGFINSSATVANANTVGGIAFQYTALGGTPVYAWGTNGAAGSNFLTQPASWSVNFANSAASANVGNSIRLTSGNNMQIGWNGSYNVYTDGQYQGDIVTTQGTQNFYANHKSANLAMERALDIGTLISHGSGNPANTHADGGGPYGGAWEGHGGNSDCFLWQRVG